MLVIARLDPEAVRTGKTENVTIRTICGMLDIALKEAETQTERTQGVLKNGVSAAKPSGWTNEDFDHATKNLDATIQAFTTVLEGAKAVAKEAKDMQVQKSEMDGVGGQGGPGAD